MPRRAGWTHALRATLSTAGGPYGYTISLGGSIAMTNGHLGSPDLGAVLCLMAGGVSAFAALEIACRTSVSGMEVEPAPPGSNVHFLAAGCALCAVWGLVHLFDGDVAWLACGLAATGLYFAVAALQRALLTRLGR